MADNSPLWYWINERHQIYLRKTAGDKWPWTEDKILQTYAFCNVFRELDRVTAWIRTQWREPFATHPNLWFMMCVARQINWPLTLAHIEQVEPGNGFPDTWDPDRQYEKLRRLQAEGHKIYTGAYMLRGDIQRDGVDNNKPRYTIYSVLDPVWKAYQNLILPVNGEPTQWKWPSIEATTKWLEAFSGWGGFLSYEVATDLRHTRYLKDAPDIMTWANPGPGAVRGLNRLAGRPVKAGIKREQALEEMRLLLRESLTSTGGHVPPLEMRDIEHSLCETDKYLRVKNGEGRPRAKYNQHAKHEF